MVYPRKISRNDFDVEKFVLESFMATEELSARLSSALSVPGNIEGIYRKNNVKREILAVENLLAVLQNRVIYMLDADKDYGGEDDEEYLVLDANTIFSIAQKINRRLRRIEYKVGLIEASPCIKRVIIGGQENGGVVVELELPKTSIDA